MHVLSRLSVRSSRAVLPVMALAMLVSGCSAGLAAYPSLAQRPAERAYAQAAPAPPPAAPPAPVAADPATMRQIARLRADAASADARFAREADTAARLAAAARGTARGSEAWAAATAALAALDAARSQSATPLATLDALRVGTAASAAGTNDAAGQASFAAVAEADDAVAAMVRDQDARSGALRRAIEN